MFIFLFPRLVQVLPEPLRSSLPDTDDEAKDDIVNAARRFLKEVLASSGRRTDLERNAFMAAAVALIPSDVFQNRKGRAVMRLLGVNYRVVKMAADMRGELEDGSNKWKLLKTAEHADRTDWSSVKKWLHSDEASCEDNNNKSLVRVNMGKDEATGQIMFEFHRARVLSESKDELREKFKRSPEFTAMSQTVISFAAYFPSSIKPSAAFGRQLQSHARGLRAHRKNGIPHTEPLPTGPIPRSVGGMDSNGSVWTLRDAQIGEFPPSFPELAVHLVITDGCGCQMKFFKSIFFIRSRFPSPCHVHVQF